MKPFVVSREPSTAPLLVIALMPASDEVVWDALAVCVDTDGRMSCVPVSQLVVRMGTPDWPEGFAHGWLDAMVGAAR